MTWRAIVAVSMVGLALLLTGITLLAGALGLRQNVTGSMPEGFYFERPASAVHRGDAVAACLPSAIARFGLRRGYLKPGTCPEGVAPVLKVVAGVAGDVVEREPHRLLVNGRLVAGCSGGAVRHDGRGRPLTPIPARVRVPVGDVYLCAPAPGSWDSRYYGPITVKNVRGVVSPLQGQAWSRRELQP